jgi:hypothetical protein
MLSKKAANTNFSAFGFTRMAYKMRGHAQNMNNQ